MMKTKANKLTKQTETVPVVMIRHAQSQWNKENRFTGWADPPLTDAGVAEAKRAGDCLQRLGYHFDAAYSSVLQRACVTLDIVLGSLGQLDLLQQRDWCLNERHYGALQGLDKTETTARYGEAQVHRWRRGYLDRAEPLSRDDQGHPLHDPRYAEVDPAMLPDVENLAETRARVVDFWQEQIVPRIRRAERILISAHGNTLRALIMELAGMSEQEVEQFEIPTGKPILYEFLRQDAKPLGWRYLADCAEQKRSA